MLSTLLLFLTIFEKCLGQSNLIQVTPTYYLGKPYEANTNPSDPDYFTVTVCENTVSLTSRGVLSVAVPTNPTWSDTGLRIIVQMSNCSGNFNENCTFATNYYYKTQSEVVAIKQISFDLDTACATASECTMYIRAFSFGSQDTYSLELSFDNNKTTNSYAYTTNNPFSGDILNKTPAQLRQYWKAAELYTIKNNEQQWFALAYCETGQTIDEIDIAVISPGSSPFGLFFFWACPQNVAYSKCTQVYAQTSGWYGNGFTSSFNQIQCADTTSTPIKNGIFIGIEGYGAEIPPATNQVLIQAEPHYAS